MRWIYILLIILLVSCTAPTTTTTQQVTTTTQQAEVVSGLDEDIGDVSGIDDLSNEDLDGVFEGLDELNW